MPVVWSSDDGNRFWNGRQVYLVLNDDSLHEKKAQMDSQDEDRKRKVDDEYRTFLSDNEEKFLPCSSQTEKLKDTVKNLQFWIEFSSWSYCNSCSYLSREKLFQRYEKRPVTKHVNVCPCKSDRYIVPMFALIPECLKKLTFADICVLRPFVLHNGDYSRMRNGYRQKTGYTHVTWKTKSVQDCIGMIQNEIRRNACQTAYTFLMKSPLSSYRNFIHMHISNLSDKREINLYQLDEHLGIECALWPHVYPFTNWCETAIKENNSRLSRKISFLTKVFSNILDYSLDYEILQFHYDMWIFTTVSGALSSARKMHATPVRALNAKTFSPGYWKMQHRLLLDAIDQFGYLSLFFTLSPYEWTFPFPKWITDIRKLTGRGPTTLAGYETIHIAHVLEQLIRGYITGSNQSSWKRHILSYGNRGNVKNVNTYFYRFEFQQRGTVHVHLLVWLKNISQIQYNLIRADIPYEDKDLAFLVHKLQPSDKNALPLNDETTSIDIVNSNRILNIFHPAEAFAINLRGYIQTILPTLSCRMDVQTTDGKGMILRYVTSYVSKWKDAYNNELLYSSHVTPYQAAYSHIKQMEPCEPEMWLHLSSLKMSWSSSRTKEYSVPISSTITDNVIHRKYVSRPDSMAEMSFLEWLRSVDHTKAHCPAYKGGNTLVSTRMVSPFSHEFFFQFLLMNYPHTDVHQFHHPQHDELPIRLRFFASNVYLNSEFWENADAI
jgi:hypothetical protein